MLSITLFIPRKALQSTISTWASKMSMASLQIALAKVDFPLPQKIIFVRNLNIANNTDSFCHCGKHLSQSFCLVRGLFVLTVVHICIALFSLHSFFVYIISLREVHAKKAEKLKNCLRSHLVSTGQRWASNQDLLLVHPINHATCR